MDQLLDWYFSLDIYFSLGLIIAYCVFIFLFISIKGRTGFAKSAWNFVIIIILVFNFMMFTFINPSYWGYGKPNSFHMMQITEDHVVLYDRLFTMIMPSDDGASDAQVYPNLRIHVVDRETHKKLYSHLIGDYYFPMNYGNYVLLYEHDTYDGRDNGISSIETYDVEKETIRHIVAVGDHLEVDGQKVVVHSIENRGDIIVQTKTADRFVLDTKTLTFKSSPNTSEPTKQSAFDLRNQDMNSHKMFLRINNNLTELSYIDGKIVNEGKFGGHTYILIHAYREIEKNGPYVALLDETGQELWQKGLPELKKDTDDDGLEYIHRTLFYDSLCYITSNNYLLEYDLKSGKKNWLTAL